MAQPIKKYGKEFPAGTSRLNIEIFCLRHDTRKDHEGGRLASFDHFRKMVDIIFNGPNSLRKHIWSDESERMGREFLGDRGAQQYVGVAGNSSSGKSDFLGLFCIVMYLTGPFDTFCILTSTTLELAKQRVWKAVREYWNQVEHYFKGIGARVPGNAVHSKGRIRGLEPSGGYSDATGLFLAAADKQKGEDASSKIQGAKVPGKGLLILGADELPDLAPNILTVAYTNLVNNYMFWMYALGNPTLKLDPHGKFCEPKLGWKSVEDWPLEWKTERGKVIRFESENSSRIREEESWSPEERGRRKTKFFWQPSREAIEAAEKTFGRTSRQFCQMYLAVWSNSKAPNAIYSENELLRAAIQEQPEWDNPTAVIPASGMDSSYTSGGDLSVSVPGLFGTVKGVKHLHVLPEVVLEADENSDLAPAHQIVRAWMRDCQQREIRPRSAGFDNSGAGIPFGNIVEMEWHPSVRKINFGGKPSDRVHRIDGVSQEEFANRVSELWVQPKEFIRGDRDEFGEFNSQITGLSPRIIEEMVSRNYDDEGEGAKLKVEKKVKMRKRTGKSPDTSDALMILIEIGIQNGWLDSQEEKKILRRVNREWTESKKKLRLRTRRRAQNLRW